MFRPRMCTFIAASAALALTGCGSSSSNGSGGHHSAGAPTATTSANEIARAADVSTSESGYRFGLRLTEGSAALGGTLTGTGTGTFNLPKHAGEIDLNMALPGAASAAGNLAIKEVIEGRDIFIELPALISARLPGGKPWIEMNLDKAGKLAGVSNLGSLTGGAGSTDPSQFLQYLRASDPRGVKQVGSATVNGVATTEYRGTVDLARAASFAPAASRAQARQAIAQIEKLSGLKTLPVDVFIDAKNLVRRFIINYGATIKGQSVNTHLQLDFLSYGPQPVPAAPAPGQVTDLTSLLGGLTSLSG